MIRILYPDRRHVTEAWVIAQAFDAKCNAALADAGGTFEDDADRAAFAARLTATIAQPDLDEAMDLLADLGLVTFADLDRTEDR